MQQMGFYEVVNHLKNTCLEKYCMLLGCALKGRGAHTVLINSKSYLQVKENGDSSSLQGYFIRYG